MLSSPSSSSQLTTTTSESKPVPCHLSTSQVDNLLHHVFCRQDHGPSSTEKNVAASTNSSSSLRSPTTKLTGRPVMVPMTGQAFVMGKLQPTIDPKTNEEQLQVKLPSSTSSKAKSQQAQSYTWTTTQVEEWLLSNSSSSKALMTKATSSDENDTTKQPKKKIQNSSFRQKQEQPSPSSSTTTSYAGGFVDIHEEYAADGRPVKQEAINVTQQLQSLLNQQSSASSSTSPTATTTMNGGVIDSEQDLNSDEGDGDDNGPTEDTKTKNVVTDDDYNQIMSRLDELALLEEKHNAEQSQSKLGTLVKNRNDKKSPSGGGWNKGFLNSNKNAKKKKKSTTPQTTQTIPSVATPTTTAAMKPPAATTGKNNSSRVDANSGGGGDAVSRVSFSGETHVKEIPRIGTKSTASLQQPRSKPATTATSSGMPIKESTQSFFSSGGVIRERPTGTIGERGGGAGGDGTIKERSNNSNAGQKQKATSTTTATRPLSRFARERQGEM